MSRINKILTQILTGRSDANILFKDLKNLLLHVGFEERIKGSHHIFRRAGVDEKINIQKEGNKAKPYQVRQVRNILLKYRIGEELNE